MSGKLWVTALILVVALAVIIGLGLLAYWALARNRRVCDFLIATEGEMKKVNWSSRQEIVVSTVVVIAVVVITAVLLGAADFFLQLSISWLMR